MYKVGVCGYFAQDINAHNGQTIKTRTITSELINILGVDKVKIVDTYNWKRNIFSLIVKCYNLTKTCENVIVLPAQNGIKIFPSLFFFFNRRFHRKFHYIVVGGWLPGLLTKNLKLKIRVNKFEGVYVETNSMVKSLTNMGLKNIRYLPNFKQLDVIEEADLVYPNDEPYKLCTFSRVMKEKGIEDAIKAIKGINKKFERVVFTLDIYGQVDGKYFEKFGEIQKDFPAFIAYKGIVDSNDSVNTLKNYCALIFPTYYEGEGFAGTILDAFASGVPVIATNWKYNSEIIQDRTDGFIYDYKNLDELELVFEDILQDIEIITSMKKKCLDRAKQYLPEVVMCEFMKYL